MTKPAVVACQICAAPIPQRPGRGRPRNYCEECAPLRTKTQRDSHRTGTNRKCPTCGDRAEPRQQYCAAHGDRTHPRPLTHRRCSTCRRTYMPQAPTQRYCSTKCRPNRFALIKRDPTRHAQRYGTQHRQTRRAFAARHQPTDPCVRCHKPLGPIGPRLHLDHAEDGSYLGFAHAGCNVKAGARKGHATSTRSQHPQRAQSRAW